MFEKLINSVLNSDFGLGAVSVAVAIWLYGTLGGNKPNKNTTGDNIDRKTGLTERESLLLEKQQAEMRVLQLEEKLNTERRIREMELQIVAMETLYGIPKHDETKATDPLAQKVSELVHRNNADKKQDKESTDE